MFPGPGPFRLCPEAASFTRGGSTAQLRDGQVLFNAIVLAELSWQARYSGSLASQTLQQSKPNRSIMLAQPAETSLYDAAVLLSVKCNSH